MGLGSPGGGRSAHSCPVLCFLQIMIEFCPGGAVDAIMLGKSSWAVQDPAGGGGPTRVLVGSCMVLLRLKHLSALSLCGDKLGLLGENCGHSLKD